MHDAAFANELYMKHLLLTKNDPDEAYFHFEKAILLYREWGAEKKVEILTTKYTVESRRLSICESH